MGAAPSLLRLIGDIGFRGKGDQPGSAVIGTKVRFNVPGKKAGVPEGPDIFLRTRHHAADTGDVGGKELRRARGGIQKRKLIQLQNQTLKMENTIQILLVSHLNMPMNI